MSHPRGSHWDIFCSVVDNFGDIGIAWRLARQLSEEYGIRVRLWVDDLGSFRSIRPEIDPHRGRQELAGVEIRRWRRPMDDFAPGAVVIEALACHLPDVVEQAMAKCAPQPAWINLEYLSAEDWVVGCHGLPSPHPRLPLTKHFFLPGYVSGTGGVLCEAWLARQRDAFQADAAARDAFWARLGVPPETTGEARISLFAYETPRVATLLEQWAHGPERVRCLLPVGKITADVARALGRCDLAPGEQVTSHNLTVQCLPMLDQDAYDRLLWACDWNFVRGEDSFVRAQWALRPLVWQAYRQEQDAHLLKLAAFLDLYSSGLDPALARLLRSVWLGWNESGDIGEQWPGYCRHQAAWAAHARLWAGKLAGLGNLAGNLVNFCEEKL